ncbi:MAG TPA: ROK family transcriptional regulator [Actinophytocola sp.]|uniref:ROK family transcriptional regulator n=1 Tax=Actinophytocola sp. TaxID=1872138 RepID=UPI002DDCCF81|nr:ROK family transcriptional regulator [Actinophytocola sp.]HEV2782372.1 ROK family transcriptional regulator [Actinophytocola sp.]
MNDKAALEVLLERGPLTRSQLASITGISKPTASQLLARLQASGLVVRDGIREGLPGRTAELYRVNPRASYVAGVDVTPGRICVRVAEITGQVIGEHELATPGRSGGQVVERVRAAIDGACGPAGITIAQLGRVVIGVPGAVNPATGRLFYAPHLSGWHVPRLVETLADGLGVPVAVENDVNLVAQAEQAYGVATEAPSFAVVWIGNGIGMALVIDGRLYRGWTGGAGEVGYMPVPGAPTARDVGRTANHGMQAFAGGPAVHKIMRSHGFRGHDPAAAVRFATRVLTSGRDGERRQRAHFALSDVAGRVAMGLAAIVAVVDPALVVLTGAVALAGGEALRALIERELHAISLPRPPVRLSVLSAEPVLEGALVLALRQAQDELFTSTVP